MFYDILCLLARPPFDFWPCGLCVLHGSGRDGCELVDVRFILFVRYFVQCSLLLLGNCSTLLYSTISHSPQNTGCSHPVRPRVCKQKRSRGMGDWLLIIILFEQFYYGIR